jgi:hypothetical protein
VGWGRMRVGQGQNLHFHLRGVYRERPRDRNAKDALVILIKSQSSLSFP